MAPCHGFFKDAVDENPPILPEIQKKQNVNSITLQVRCVFTQSRYPGIGKAVDERRRKTLEPLKSGLYADLIQAANTLQIPFLDIACFRNIIAF